jgi:hypothetical protein
MKSGQYILNDQGYSIPCDDLLDWGMWFGTERLKWCLSDTVAGFRVSTIFLGLDHNWGRGDPLLWETMIFDEVNTVPTEVFGKVRNIAPEIGQWRFTHREEAYAFHRGKVKEFVDRLAAVETKSFVFSASDAMKE